jgi:hypothetical protein
MRGHWDVAAAVDVSILVVWLLPHGLSRCVRAVESYSGALGRSSATTGGCNLRWSYALTLRQDGALRHAGLRHREKFGRAVICSSRLNLPLGACVRDASGDRWLKPSIGALLGVLEPGSALFGLGELTLHACSAGLGVLGVGGLLPPVVLGFHALGAMLCPAVPPHGGVEVSLPEFEFSRHAPVAGWFFDSPLTLFERHNSGSAWHVEIFDRDADFLETVSVPPAWER